jgi:hypothetical protein
MTPTTHGLALLALTFLALAAFTRFVWRISGHVERIARLLMGGRRTW